MTESANQSSISFLFAFLSQLEVVFNPISRAHGCLLHSLGVEIHCTKFSSLIRCRTESSSSFASSACLLPFQEKERIRLTLNSKCSGNRIDSRFWSRDERWGGCSEILISGFWDIIVGDDDFVEVPPSFEDNKLKKSL